MRFFEDVASKKRVNENVDALFRRCCFQKARQRKRRRAFSKILLPKSAKKVLSRLRNGDIGYENDGKEHQETDETGDDGEDEDENEEDEDDDADEEKEGDEGENFDDEGEYGRCSKDIIKIFGCDNEDE